MVQNKAWKMTQVLNQHNFFLNQNLDNYFTILRYGGKTDNSKTTRQLNLCISVYCVYMLKTACLAKSILFIPHNEKNYTQLIILLSV